MRSMARTQEIARNQLQPADCQVIGLPPLGAHSAASCRLTITTAALAVA
jgi:hypothetical protein